MMDSFSSYLKEIKPLLKKLLNQLLKKFPYVSILASDCKGKNVRVSQDDIQVQDNRWDERGFVVRVYNKINYSEYSFNQINEEILPKIVEKIIEECDVKDCIEKAIYAKVYNYSCLEEEKITKSFSRIKEEKKHSLNDIIKFGKRIVERCFEENEYVINARLNFEYLLVSKMFLSKNKDLEQVYLWSDASVFIIVNRDETTKSNHGSCSGLSINNVMHSLEHQLSDILEKATLLLDSEPATMGEYDIITTPEVTGLIAHEAFGHGVEMDMFVKKRALAENYIGKMVASPLVTMHDGATPLDDVSSYFFDDEGVLAHDTIIIKNGILQTGIADSLAALRLKIAPTGNGKRESFTHKAYTRMTTTYFERGNVNTNELLSNVKKGNLISGLLSGMEDPKNWGIQCVCCIGEEIVDGVKTGKVISPVYMSGYVLDLLKSVSIISKEFGINGAGSCGKGYKEWVKNSNGGPYMKARVKIG